MEHLAQGVADRNPGELQEALARAEQLLQCGRARVERTRRRVQETLLVLKVSEQLSSSCVLYWQNRRRSLRNQGCQQEVLNKMSAKTDISWQEIARRASEEHDPEKLKQLADELIQALDQQTGFAPRPTLEDSKEEQHKSA
jgi:hypothetical protein